MIVVEGAKPDVPKSCDVMEIMLRLAMNPVLNVSGVFCISLLGPLAWAPGQGNPWLGAAPSLGKGFSWPGTPQGPR